jgi:hypothetical protein
MIKKFLAQYHKIKNNANILLNSGRIRGVMIGGCENFGMAEITALDAFPYKRLLRKGIFFVSAASSATARFGCWYVVTALLRIHGVDGVGVGPP